MEKNIVLGFRKNINLKALNEAQKKQLYEDYKKEKGPEVREHTVLSQGNPINITNVARCSTFKFDGKTQMLASSDVDSPTLDSYSLLRPIYSRHPRMHHPADSFLIRRVLQYRLPGEGRPNWLLSYCNRRHDPRQS
jgi:hypothetical protein